MQIISLSKAFLSCVLCIVFYLINISVFLLLALNGYTNFAVFSYITLFILDSIIYFYISKKYVHIVINKFLTIIIYTLFIAGLFAILFICIPNFFTFFLFVRYIFFEIFHDEIIVNLIFMQFILPILAFIFGIIKQSKKTGDQNNKGDGSKKSGDSSMI